MWLLVGMRNCDVFVHVPFHRLSSFWCWASVRTRIHLFVLPDDLFAGSCSVAATTGGAIPQYRSTFSALCRIFEQEGMRGLWKGVGVTAAASCVSWTCFRYA